jgi:hypothetical protein
MGAAVSKLGREEQLPWLNRNGSSTCSSDKRSRLAYRLALCDGSVEVELALL